MSEQNEEQGLDEKVIFFGGAYSNEEIKASRQYENEQIDRALQALLNVAEEGTTWDARVDAATAVLRFHLASNGKSWG